MDFFMTKENTHNQITNTYNTGTEAHEVHTRQPVLCRLVNTHLFSHELYNTEMRIVSV